MRKSVPFAEQSQEQSAARGHLPEARARDTLSTVAETFWTRVEKARGRLNDAQLAKKLNVSRSTIKRWRDGDATPDTKQIEKLTALFGLPANHWLGQNPATISARQILTADEEWLLREIGRDEQLEAAVRAVVKNWRFPDDAL